MGYTKRKSRKASLAAFCVVAFAALASANDTPRKHGEDVEVIDPAVEASRAYKQAISTLATLTALPPMQSEEPAHHSTSVPLSSFLPSMQGQGPIASALRILAKLRNHSWLPSVVTDLLGRELTNGRKKDEELKGRAVKVIDLLQHAAELGHTDALYTLGQVSLFPPNSYFPSNPTAAYESFQTHADVTGNASSQALVGFFHSTGYHSVVPVDQAMAQLYLTFAAHGNHKGAQMALGYRYWSGIGVAENCMAALDWYEDAAEQAMAKFLSGPPGGRTLPLQPPRLSDLDGGVYGPGASVASTGLNAGRAVIKTANARAAGETWDDLLEYYLFNADRGETDFAYRLGKIYYQGSIYGAPGGAASGGDGASIVPRDFHRARYYFLRIARQVWPRDPANPRQPDRPSKEETPVQSGYAALAAGYLGRMYLRGEGVKQDPVLAKMWFERGADYGEKESHNGLGIIWRDGLVDGKKDVKKAMAHFAAAATQELAEAQVNIGKYHYERGDLKLATAYFETALRQGSPFEAYYYLADIQGRQARSTMLPPEIAGSSCAIAVSFYKLVAERGTWEEDLLRDADYAWSLGTERGSEMAMLRWWIAAERGYEVAQNNLAYVLDQDKSILRFTRFAPQSPSNDTARLALTQWIRSAAQRNVDALVKVGDYYYHGLGVPDESESVRWEKAAGYYQSAADTQMSALAMWNLGWMYENGIGVPQDFHLAKRHYDLAYETNSEAYLPVLLSLLKLHARSIWHTVMGGKNGLTIWDSDEDNAARSYYDQPEIEGDADQGPKQPSLDEVDEFADDGAWYMGKARDEFNRRKRGQHDDRDRRAAREEEDPVQWARERRQAEAAERDREGGGDFGPEDYFDAAIRGQRYREEEDVDEFAETMLLVVLCLMVSVLLYVRGRWVDRIRREEEERRRQGGGGQPDQQQVQGANGVFPPPGDPARDDWAILR
ncbi:HCP-like protein [Dichomitus squalens LYAD-421 SS1]|uniref:HCP-like protein n=1 Tax=Dichomitus squalens (strain LYAD-421) TaxID=732165 RepID=R7SN71_DICSQ|nr:HCP-like protein [Dichomitus squalens LYAD-421 SS1]EJF57566.1 HCP-like protein [Dichomitus squalens LYAD-421 SS1]